MEEWEEEEERPGVVGRGGMETLDVDSATWRRKGTVEVMEGRTGWVTGAAGREGVEEGEGSRWGNNMGGKGRGEERRGKTGTRENIGRREGDFDFKI